MGKSTHFLGQPILGQLLNYLNRAKTVSLFSNLIFKGVGRNPKTGKKKGGIKVHSVIHANEGVPCDIQFTSAAKHDHFLLAPDKLTAGDILTMDRALCAISTERVLMPSRYRYG